MHAEKNHRNPTIFALVLASLVVVASPAAALGPAIDPDGLRASWPVPREAVGGSDHEAVRRSNSP